MLCATHAAFSISFMALKAMASLAFASLGVVASRSSGQSVCMPGAATSGSSQLQVSAKVPGFQVSRDAAAPLLKTEVASLPNASLVEVEGGLFLQSGAQLAESFLLRADRAELALATLHKRMSPATQELSNAVSRLVEDQGASPVGCKARLKEADLKLKDIMEMISSTASVLKASKKEVEVVDTQLKQTLASIKDADDAKAKGSETCAKKKATDKMMLDKLTADIKVMRSMKTVTQSPTVRPSVQPVASLLATTAQMPKTSNKESVSIRPEHAGIQTMIDNAKAASLEVHNCLKQHASASLIEREPMSVTFDFDDLDDALGDDDDAEDEDVVVGAQTSATPMMADQPAKVASAASKISEPPAVVALPAARVINARSHQEPSDTETPAKPSVDPVPTTEVEQQPAVLDPLPRHTVDPAPIPNVTRADPPPQTAADPAPTPTVAPADPFPQPAVDPAPNPPVTQPSVEQHPAVTDPRIPTLQTEPDHCKVEREKLEETWVEAYEEVTREVESYEILVDDTSCVDASEAEYQEQFQPLQQEEKELSKKVSSAISKVQTLRPQIKSLRQARKELEKRLKVITQECEAVEETKETLEATKEVIVKMDECVSDGSAFNLPVWVGQWITVQLSEDLSIADADAKMNQGCAASFGHAARAAEVSEVDTGSIRKMPKKNKSDLPMMPTCPLCGTKLARVCWDSGARLNHRKRRTDCTPGARAVLCVSTDVSQSQ